MKSKLIALTLAISITQMATAQLGSETRSSMHSLDGSSSQGVRVSLLKPFFDVELTGSKGSQSKTIKAPLTEAIGFSLGYAQLPIQQLGWTTNLLTNELFPTEFAKLNPQMAA